MKAINYRATPAYYDAENERHDMLREDVPFFLGQLPRGKRLRILELACGTARAAMIEKLFPLADLVTPNIPEAERIAKMKIASAADLERAAAVMRSMGARNVLIKGGHQKADGKNTKARDYLYIGDEVTIFEAEFIETSATHGTGCTLAAAIAANLALGKDLTEAVKIAKDFVTEAIRTAPNIGKGNSPINI